MARLETKFCPRCKSEQGAIEKMACWICSRCRIIVAYKDGTLTDVLTIIKEQKDAIEKRKQSQNDQQ